MSAAAPRQPIKDVRTADALRTVFADVREFNEPGIISKLYDATCPDCGGPMPVVLRTSGEVFAKCLRNGGPHAKLRRLLEGANSPAAKSARRDSVSNKAGGQHVGDDDGGELRDTDDGPPYTMSLREMIANPAILAPPMPVARGLAWRGRSTLLAAREKLGKSTFVTAGAAATSAGAPFLDQPTERGGVFWVGTDESPGDAVRRFVAFGADPDNIHLLTRRPPPDEIVGVVRAGVERLRPVLVVIDTLPTFVSGLVTDYNDATGYTPVITDLTQIARDLDCALVLIHHGKKDDSGYRDSTAIGAGVDMILTMTGKADESKRTLTALGRFPLDNYTVRLDGTRYLLAGSGEDTLEIRILDWLRRNPGGHSTNGVRSGVGGNTSEVGRTLEHLKFTSLVIDAGNQSGHHWKIAPVEPDPALFPAPE